MVPSQAFIKLSLKRIQQKSPRQNNLVRCQMNRTMINLKVATFKNRSRVASLSQLDLLWPISMRIVRLRHKVQRVLEIDKSNLSWNPLLCPSSSEVNKRRNQVLRENKRKPEGLVEFALKKTHIKKSGSSRSLTPVTKLVKKMGQLIQLLSKTKSQRRRELQSLHRPESKY